MSTPPRRRWFQFSLRTMFVVVAMMAIVTAATVVIGPLLPYIAIYLIADPAEAPKGSQ